MRIFVCKLLKHAFKDYSSTKSSFRHQNWHLAGDHWKDRESNSGYTTKSEHWSSHHIKIKSYLEIY